MHMYIVDVAKNVHLLFEHTAMHMYIVNVVLECPFTIQAHCNAYVYSECGLRMSIYYSSTLQCICI